MLSKNPLFFADQAPTRHLPSLVLLRRAAAVHSVAADSAAPIRVLGGCLLVWSQLGWQSAARPAAVVERVALKHLLPLQHLTLPLGAAGGAAGGAAVGLLAGYGR